MLSVVKSIPVNRKRELKYLSRYFKGPARYFYEDLSFPNSITQPGVNSTPLSFLPSFLFISYFSFLHLFSPSNCYLFHLCPTTIIISMFPPYFTLQDHWFKIRYSIVSSFYSPILLLLWSSYIFFVLFINSFKHILHDSFLISKFSPKSFTFCAYFLLFLFFLWDPFYKYFYYVSMCQNNSFFQSICSISWKALSLGENSKRKPIEK